MDDFDIYDDLQLLQEQGKQKAEEDLLWKEKYHVALGTIEKLQVENKELKKKIKLLETNFGGLLDTARTEIKRKDNQIAELRTEIDNICFRRVIRPGGKHSNSDAPTHRSRSEQDRPFAHDSNKNDDTEKKSTFGKIEGANYKQPYSRNVEEKKRDGPGHSGQSRNPFQGESSGRLGSSRSKNARESHTHKQPSDQDSLASIQHISKQEKIEENKNRIANLENNKNKSNKEKLESVREDKQDHGINESVRNVKDEKVLEEAILKDLKELKRKKHIDVKKDVETKESTPIATNQKSNVFFDALFDDLVMNEENSKDIYCDLETRPTEIVCDVKKNENKTKDAETSIIDHKLSTPQKPSTTKLLVDLFGASPNDPGKQEIEQVHPPINNDIELKSTMNKISATKLEKENKPFKEIEVELPCKSEVQPCKKLCSFKFAELDSSFYSSDEERTNEDVKDKGSLSKTNDVASNLNKNCEDLNGVMVTNDAIKSKVEDKNLDTIIVNHNEDVHIHKKVTEGTESKYKNLQTDKQEKTISARHISERKEVKVRDGMKDHTHPSKHSRNSSRSKSHKHEKESLEKVHSRNSKVSGNSNESSENKSDRKSKGKNKNVCLNEKQKAVEVPSKESTPSSCVDMTLVQPANEKERRRSCNKKQQENIATLEFADDEGFEKKTNLIRESNNGKECLIANVTDKLPRNELENDRATEPHKTLQTDHKRTDELGNISKPMNVNVEADLSKNKNYEEQTADASNIELVVSKNSPSADDKNSQQEEIISNVDKIFIDESSKALKDEQQKCTLKASLKDGDYTNKCGQTKKETPSIDLVLGQDENNVPKPVIFILDNDVDLKQDIKDCSSDVCESNNLDNLNHELVNISNNQIKEVCRHKKFHESKEKVILEVASDIVALMTKERDEENLKEIDLKSNQSKKDDADSTIINASPEDVSGRYRKLRSDKLKESEINLSSVCNDPSKQQLETDFGNQVHNKVKNECDTSKPAKEIVVESDIDDNEHIEMPPLLVEEEPEENSSCEKLPEIKTNSESLVVSVVNVPKNENKRIHHKKRMIQNSRTMETVSTIVKNSILENNVSSELDVEKVLRTNFNHYQVDQKSISPDGITRSKPESDKISLNFTSSDGKQSSPLEPPPSEAKDSSENCGSNARYKKKILQKYKDSNNSEKNALQHNSSICETNATSTHYNITSHNDTYLEKLTDENKDITETPSDKRTHETSKDSDLRVLDSSTNNSSHLQKSNKPKQIQITTVVVQREKRKLPLTTESENLNPSKILKLSIQDSVQEQDKKASKVSATKERICKNFKTSNLQNLNASFVPSVDTTELSKPEAKKVSNHNPENSLVVPTKNNRIEQSNEVSSQSLVRSKETLNNDVCNSELTKSNVAKTEEDSVLYLKRKTKTIPPSKKRKRNLRSPNSSGETEEKTSKSKKKSKKINKNKQSNCKNEKSSPSPSNSEVIQHNIFSNDDCLDEKNLPVICNDNDDAQYQEIDKRMRSMFQSPTYKSSAMENPFDNKSCTSPQSNNDTISKSAVDETINKGEKSQCDTSTSSRKISVGSNDYVIETVGAHVANVFITRKKCKKRPKIVVATI